MLADAYGRVATDLRVSLTDRCNLRCDYCMPAEGLDWLPRPDLLTDDEVVRLVRIGVQRLGITEVRFTGGEPLLRRGLPDIVARTAELRPRPEISLTTNGIGLERLAGSLRDAGLDRINVSLDTLDPARLLALTRRDRHAQPGNQTRQWYGRLRDPDRHAQPSRRQHIGERGIRRQYRERRAQQRRSHECAQEPRIQHRHVDVLHRCDPLRGRHARERPHHERREGEENAADDARAERACDRADIHQSACVHGRHLVVGEASVGPGGAI